jgi:thioredoxin-dependent peroxiredoxin
MTRRPPVILVAVLLGCGGAQPAPQTPHAPPAVGTQVPPLSRVDQRGQVVALRAGTPTLLYFFPKAGTPGCTKEACAIRDAWDDYQLSKLRVIGVSIDTDAEHRAFAKEHALPFSLVSDPSHAWSEAFGVGTFNGLDDRVSFLIDANDRIVKSYENVDPGVHAQEVLRDAKALGLVP